MKPLPKRLRKLMADHLDKFDEGWSEQDEFFSRRGWSHWLYLKPGWHNGDPGSHIIHEANVRDCLEAFKLVAACSCDDCTQATVQK